MKLVEIVDYFGEKHLIPVNDKVYEVMTGTEFDEERQDKRSYRHRAIEEDGEYANPEEYSEADSIEDLADVVAEQMQRKELYDAIARLTPTQRRRVYMYMMQMNYSEIAEAESKHHEVIRRSLFGSFKKLRRILTEVK